MACPIADTQCLEILSRENFKEKLFQVASADFKTLLKKILKNRVWLKELAAVATLLICILSNFSGTTTDPNRTVIRQQTNVVTKLTIRPQRHPYKNSNSLCVTTRSLDVIYSWVGLKTLAKNYKYKKK